mgnify:CR=1 FL=1
MNESSSNSVNIQSSSNLLLPGHMTSFIKPTPPTPRNSEANAAAIYRGSANEVRFDDDDNDDDDSGNDAGGPKRIGFVVPNLVMPSSARSENSKLTTRQRGGNSNIPNQGDQTERGGSGDDSVELVELKMRLETLSISTEKLKYIR